MKLKSFLALAASCLLVGASLAEDISTLDGQKYRDVRDVTVKANGLYFVVGEGDSMRGVTVPFKNLTTDVQEKYHCDPYEMALAYARRNERLYLNKNLFFSFDNLEAAKKKAKDENKLIGFIMTWDNFFIPSRPMAPGSNSALAHFYDVFHDNMVLVFVRHEDELDKVPKAVNKGFGGPEEGGYAPNMAVVTADCSQFVCEIPYGGDGSTGQIREPIFRQKIDVIKKFLKGQN
jgi:hypothetical protein